MITNLNETCYKVYKNIDYIYLYFEDTFAPGLQWIRKGDLMYLLTNKDMMVSFDNKIFQEI